MLNITHYQRNANQNHNEVPQWSEWSQWSEWLLSKSLQVINAGKGVEKREPSYTVGGNAIPLLHIHTKETRIERDACTPMFITALFTIARTWKQPSCPSADAWIRKLWYIYTMEYYSAIKKNTFESVLMS